MKLVRDNIPQIIASSGKCVSCRYANSNNEKQQLLIDKLCEEISELITSFGSLDKEGIKEEMGDVLEVIDAMCNFAEVDKNEVIDMKEKKRFERGGFEKFFY